MKKFLSLFTALTLTAVLGACGREEANETPEPTTTGEETTDVVSRPTSAVGSTIDELQTAMAVDGPWVFGVRADIETDETIYVNGNVYKNDNPEEGYTRKIGLYARVGGGDRTINEVFDITASSIVANAENTLIMGGEEENLGDLALPVVNADIYVNAPGFTAMNVIINGDITFATQEYQDSADLTTATVNGTVSVE